MLLDNTVFLILAISVLTHSEKKTPRNNVCRTFSGYFNLTNYKNCFYRADSLMETPELVRKYIGILKTYTVTTEDGYILKMFRIPRNNPKGVILFQHALTVDSRIWVGQGYNSLAFYFWRNGYDIWMNNNRGTLFSQRHKTLLASQLSYWNFSFHEVGFYDVPSQIELMKKVTNISKIIYIGHSFGTTAGLVYGSLRSVEAERSVKAFVLMGTSCFFKYSTSLLINIVQFKNVLEYFAEYFGNLLFFPVFAITRVVFRLFPILLITTNIIISLINGLTPNETDSTLFNPDVAIYLKGTSLKSIMHYLQLIEKQTKFQMYDYGEKENLNRYNSKTPPDYPLQNFSVPIFFVSSTEDILSSLKDTDLLIQMLPKKVLIYGHYKISVINHVQYFIGKHRNIYADKLLDVVNNISIS